jgi:hypothetical protein
VVKGKNSNWTLATHFVRAGDLSIAVSLRSLCGPAMRDAALQKSLDFARKSRNQVAACQARSLTRKTAVGCPG